MKKKIVKDNVIECILRKELKKREEEKKDILEKSNDDDIRAISRVFMLNIEIRDIQKGIRELKK